MSQLSYSVEQGHQLLDCTIGHDNSLGVIAINHVVSKQLFHAQHIMLSVLHRTL